MSPNRTKNQGNPEMESFFWIVLIVSIIVAVLFGLIAIII